MKYCDLGEHEVPVLFHSRKTNRPSCCPKCYRPNQSITQGKKVAQKPLKLVKHYIIPKVSDKQSKINSAYTVLRKEFLRIRSHCGVCGGEATQVHHIIGRGIRTLDTSEWLPVCYPCHERIEHEPNWAKENGYSKDRL